MPTITIKEFVFCTLFAAMLIGCNNKPDNSSGSEIGSMSGTDNKTNDKTDQEEKNRNRNEDEDKDSDTEEERSFSKSTLLGEWTFSEIDYTEPNSFMKLSKEEQRMRREEDEEEARGSTMTFRKDNTLYVTTFDDEINGTYELRGDVLSIKKEGSSKVESARVLNLNSNTLKLHDEKEGLIVAFTKKD